MLIGVLILTSETDKSQSTVFAICRHGGSSHFGVWSLANLIASNYNLKEFKRGFENGDEFYIIPNPNDLRELRGQAIFVPTPESRIIKLTLPCDLLFNYDGIMV